MLERQLREGSLTGQHLGVLPAEGATGPHSPRHECFQSGQGAVRRPVQLGRGSAGSRGGGNKAREVAGRSHRA